LIAQVIKLSAMLKTLVRTLLLRSNQ
jgi:hypothetical protein